MKRGQDLSVGGIPFRLCLHMMRHPGRAYFSNEVAAMFGIASKEVSIRLKPAYEAGWLDIEKQGHMNVYSAGPKLAAMEAL